MVPIQDLAAAVWPSRREPKFDSASYRNCAPGEFAADGSATREAESRLDAFGLTTRGQAGVGPGGIVENERFTRS